MIKDKKINRISTSRQTDAEEEKASYLYLQQHQSPSNFKNNIIVSSEDTDDESNDNGNDNDNDVILNGNQQEFYNDNDVVTPQNFMNHNKNNSSDFDHNKSLAHNVIDDNASNDNDDDEEEQDDDDDDDEDDDDDDSWKSIFLSSWKQHTVAILVAIVATVTSYYVQQQQQVLTAVVPMSAPTTYRMQVVTQPKGQRQVKMMEQQRLLMERHAHLDKYQRTANITFLCSDAATMTPSTMNAITDTNYRNHPNDINTSRAMTTIILPVPEQNLYVMDFTIPKELIPIMALHYAADWEQDDNYSNVLSKASTASTSSEASVSSIFHSSHSNNQQQHPQLECLKQLQETTTKSYIQGWTWYYQNPSIESMYRTDNDDNNNNIKNKQKQIAVKQQEEEEQNQPQLWMNNNDSDNESNSRKQKNKKNTLQAAHLSFTGFAAKFVNLSPNPILLYWDGRDGVDSRRLVGEVSPYEALTTATTPGQSFSVSPVYDHTIEYNRWVVTADDAIIYYEPTSADEQSRHKQLTTIEQQLYSMQILNKEFAKHYQIHAKRTWLGHFPRPFPVHPMWSADYFGQQHQIILPRKDEEGEEQHEKETYTLTVASVTPRVFTISNFLSSEECDKLIELAQIQGMEGSTVYAGGKMTYQHQKQRNVATRSSSNAWLARNTAEITDQIYQRAAQILQIDEGLLQAPRIDDELHAHYHSIAESLQVIRYRSSEEYTPHHDWVLPSQRHRHQPTRFATLLVYLNDNYKGGHTVFPRAKNAYYHDGIRIVPKKGNAILFYNILPDGNVDDLSQHSSEPVQKGEKYAANVWIWEPMIN